MTGFDPNQQIPGFGVNRPAAPPSPQQNFAQPPSFVGAVVDRSAEVGRGIIDAAKTGGVLGAGKQLASTIAGGYHELGNTITRPLVTAGATLLAGQGAGQAAQKFLTPSQPSAPLDAAGQIQANSQSTIKPATSTSPGRSEAQVTAPQDINNVQQGYGVAKFAGGPTYNVTPQGVSRDDGKAMGGTVSYLKDDKTAETMAKQASHAQGMDRLRKGLPYDEKEFQAMQSQQQQNALMDRALGPNPAATGPSDWELHNAELAASRGGSRADKLRYAALAGRGASAAVGDKQGQNAAAGMYGANVQAAQAARNSAAQQQQFGIHTMMELAKMQKPTVGSATVKVPVLDEQGRPMVNPKTRQPYFQDLSAPTQNGEVQETPQMRQLALEAVRRKTMSDMSANRGIIDKLFTANPADDPAQVNAAMAQAAPGVLPQYNVQRQLVVGPDGNLTWSQ